MLFMASGFALFYVNEDTQLLERGRLLAFYKKRAIALLPLYFFVHIIYSFFYEEELSVALMLFPVDTLLMQSWFNSLFGILHNGGTWFVSCLLLSYFLFPLIQEIVKGFSEKMNLCVIIVLVFILLYSYKVCQWFELSTNYSSPLFRGLEFTLGVVLCAYRTKAYEKISRFRCLILPIGLVLLWLGIKKGYYFLWLPALALMVIAFSTFKLDFIKQRATVMKTLNYCSSLSYGFFILQMLLWKPYYSLLSYFPVLQRNRYRVMLSLGMLVFMCVAVHELYEKPVQKYLKGKLKKT